MRLRRRRQRIDRAVQITQIATLAGGVVTFILDVTANQLSTLGRWVPWTVMAGGTAIFLVLWALRYVMPPVPPPLVLPLPHVDELIGREGTVDAVAEKAASHGVVVVHGPDGIGDSSVAIKAARRLVPDQAGQRYVDLRGVRPEDSRSARMHVLRTLGLDTRASEAQAAQAVAAALMDSRQVLVIDNVSGVRQVAWVARRVPGAYIIIAGEINTDELPDTADVPVWGLEPADALTLLRHQDVKPPPGLWTRTRDWLRGVRRQSIDGRIAADRDAAETLARRYLQHPRVVIQLGRWLARNPGVSISAVLRALEQGGQAFELRVILREALAGASPGARRLLALLVAAPDVEFSDDAVAALAGTSVELTSEHLAELAGRFLVHRKPSGSRTAAQAAHIAEPVAPRVQAKAIVRLSAHYAKHARANAERLADERYADGARWFAAQDVALRGVLGVSNPPRRALPHLWVIAEALDVWFTRDRRHRERREVAELMLAQARAAGDVESQAVALIRLAAIARRRRMLRETLRRLGESEALGHGRLTWQPQLRTEWALYHLMTGDRDAARNEFSRALATRAGRDVYGRMTDLLNLVALDIQDGNHGAMLEQRLGEASRLAKRVGGVLGRARARELAGIGMCVQGDLDGAESAWSEAEALYGSIGDETGQARCARHRAACGSGHPAAR